MRTVRNFIHRTSGASAVEFGLLAGPLVLIIMGILQFYAMHVMQSTLSDALYASAATPEPALLLGQRNAYRDIVCDKTFFPETCKNSLVLEMRRLQDVPTASTAVTEMFQVGSSNDVLSLRATASVVQFVPFIPLLKAKASVVFRRPA